MPCEARNAATASSPSMTRDSAGIFTEAILHPNRFEQELENLDVAFGFVECFSPRVHSVAAEQHRVRLRMALERISPPSCEPRHVLRVGQNRNPLAVLVRCHAREPLEHLVARNLESGAVDVPLRKNRAPNGMCVQD